MKAVLTLLAGLATGVWAGGAAAVQPTPPDADPAGAYDSLGADWGAQQDQALGGVRQGRYIPLSRVIAEIRRRSPGEQLDAGIEQQAGRPVYRVRWATVKGRRVDYIVDARTGAILDTDGR